MTRRLQRLEALDPGAVHQLDAVFYELFTGKTSFEMMHEIKYERPVPPSEIADVPDALDDVLLRALATERADLKKLSQTSTTASGGCLTSYRNRRTGSPLG